MATTWRSKAMSVMIAVGATAAMATYVDAAPARPPASVPARPVPTAATATDRVRSLPPVTAHAIEVPHLGGTSTGAQSLAQIVRVVVIGGGLELVTERATVALERVPGSRTEWVGSLPAVRVVDARGTHEGWEVRWAASGIDLDSGRPSNVPTAKVHLEPGEPVVVAGLPEGLEAGKPGPAVPKGRTLFRSEPEAGGGTYEAGGTVRVRLPASVEATAATVHLTFALA